MTWGNSKRWRQAAVWMHVVTSVGWMGQALALFTLLAFAMNADDPASREAATGMARVLDNALLAPLANASAFTGFMLSAATAWGFFRHWWVLVKFTITVVQLYLGIWVLSGALHDAVEQARAPLALVVGIGLMAAAIAAQAWLSVAKPWSKTPWSGKAKIPTAPGWVFAVVVVTPFADFSLSLWTGRPLPAVSLVVLAAWLGLRRRVLSPG